MRFLIQQLPAVKMGILINQYLFEKVQLNNLQIAVPIFTNLVYLSSKLYKAYRYTNAYNHDKDAKNRSEYPCLHCFCASSTKP